MLVLIFLSAFVIGSHQEFRLQLERPIHWFPYRSSQEIPHRQVVPFQYPDQANLFGNTFAQHPTPQQLPPVQKHLMRNNLLIFIIKIRKEIFLIYLLFRISLVVPTGKIESTAITKRIKKHQQKEEQQSQMLMPS
jgi:hypothetical protein